MPRFPYPDLEPPITAWRHSLISSGLMPGAVIDLEGALRAEVLSLLGSGLNTEEALLIAMRRIARRIDGGQPDRAKETSAQRRQRQRDTAGSAAATAADLPLMLGLAMGAAAAVKIPGLFGLSATAGDALFFVRNAALLVLPWLVAWLALRAGLGLRPLLLPAAVFALAAVFANVYPLTDGSNTLLLQVLHLPLVLWLVVGMVHTGMRFADLGRRMNFVRFSGEFFIYYVLIALGGGVLIALTLMLFQAIGINAEWLVQQWLLPSGAAGAVVVAGWLAETRQRLGDNLAPMLTRIFTPLFTLVLVVFIATMAATLSPIQIARETLIVLDLLLVVVVGLVLYATSARHPHAPPGLFDRLQLTLILCALAVDVVALTAMAARISEFGLTPNRVAALGENLLLLGNLGGSAWLGLKCLRGTARYGAIERWQLRWLPVYAGWGALVVIAFPPLFGFI